MSDTRAAIKLIAGVEPTPHQVRRVQAIAHSLDIPSNDAMMPILIMLDTYYGAFSALPEKAQLAANAAAKNAADQSTLAVNTAVAQAVMNLGPQVGSAISKVAKDINQVDKVKWMGGMAVLVALAFTALGWFTHATGYASGFETGQAAGYKAAANEKAAQAWANTEQGRLAYELAQAGDLEMLARCNGRAWSLSKGICLPQPYQEGKDNMVQGWSVGKSARGSSSAKLKVGWWNSIFGSSA